MSELSKPGPEHQRFEQEVLMHLHEVARAAREVPAEHQPERLRAALTALVGLEILQAGTIRLGELDAG